MPTEYVDWHTQPDPRPDALANIRKAAEYMISRGATFSDAAVSVYAVAKALNRNNTQISNLLRQRPGFVRVENARGELGGYYYDIQNFGMTYPDTYKDIRGKRIKRIDSLSQSNVAAAREMSERIAEGVKPSTPDLTLPAFSETKRKTSLVEFSLLPVEIARDILQVAVKNMSEGSLNDDDATDILTSLLSLSAHRKASSV